MQLLSALYVKEFGVYVGYCDVQKGYMYNVGGNLYKFSRNGCEKVS